MKSIAAVILCLLLLMCAAHAEAPLDTILGFVRNGLAEKAEVVKCDLDDRTLSIVVDMSPVEPLYDGFYADLTTDYAASVTDELLNHRELDDEWDIVFIEAVNVGYFFFTKDDIHDDDAFGVRMRYFPVYDDNYNSLITLSEPAPTPVPDIPMPELLEQATRQYIDEKFSHTEIEYITVNPNYGTSAPDDYIVLPHLFWNGGAANQELIAPLSDMLAEYLTDSYPGVQELCIFWADPTDNETAVKRAYERKDGKLILTDEILAKKFQ